MDATRARRWLGALLACGGLATAACGSGDGSTTPAPAQPSPGAAAFPYATSVPLPAAASEAELLDAVFRIDIDSVEAAFDVYPGQQRADAHAVVTFRMRPGQTRPLVHFDPARSSPSVSLRLDGSSLDVRDPADVRLLSFQGSGQVSLELQRDVAGGSHRLEAVYAVPLADPGGRFYADVNDLLGRGNETLFPTLNTPRALARHELVFRVHAAEPYLAVGSGLATASASGDVQQWSFDSEREVASYTMMFHLAPARTHALSQRRVQGVDVRALAASGSPLAGQAFDDLDPWLAELQRSFGPFPMPRGLSLVLTENGGGMEYYGASTTSLRALRHEVFHMYFGTSTVARTYRDSWWDEAIDMWYERSAQPGLAPIADSFRSDIVGYRTPVTVGFDQRAYDEGARVFQAVAGEIGGRERMIAFLRDLHLRRSFDPLGTWDLVDEIRAATGADFRERFRLWLYQGANGAARQASPSPWRWLHEVDLRPPGSTRQPARPPD